MVTQIEKRSRLGDVVSSEDFQRVLQGPARLAEYMLDAVDDFDDGVRR